MDTSRRDLLAAAAGLGAATPAAARASQARRPAPPPAVGHTPRGGVAATKLSSPGNANGATFL